MKKLYLRSIPRIIAAMLFWGVAYKAYHLVRDGGFSADALWYQIRCVLLFKQEFHFYYLQMILIVYIFVPVLRVFTLNAGKKQLRYLLAVWFVFGIAYPTVNTFYPFTLFGGLTGQYYINMTYASAGYALLGHYLNEYRIRRRTAALLTAAGAVTVFAGTLTASAADGALNEVFFQGMSVGVCLLAAGIFSLCISVPAGASARSAKAFERISKASFSIYLTHMFAVYELSGVGFTALSFEPIVSVPALVVTVFVISLIVYLPLSKIPVVNKWLI